MVNARQDGMEVNGAQPTQRALGLALGLSPAAICKNKALGMPVDSIFSAQTWREKHQSIARRKPAPPVLAVQRLAEQAYETGHFDKLEDSLRRAMRRVPLAARAGVFMPDTIWKKLLSHLPELFAETGEPLATAEELAEVGPILYGLACDEMILRDDDPSRSIARC